jgi:DNA (cytosine-5)-methyltransferase 1
MNMQLPLLSETQKKNKNKKKYKIVSLFSGCGGMDLGFVQEGFEIVWANDIDKWACQTYRKNFGNHIFEGDIADLDLKNLPKADIVTGGFPCQDFSMIWKRGGINTERGNLYKYFVDVVAEIEPKIFVAENVRGLLSANNGEAIKQIVEDFQKDTTLQSTWLTLQITARLSCGKEY